MEGEWRTLLEALVCERINTAVLLLLLLPDNPFHVSSQPFRVFPRLIRSGTKFPRAWPPSHSPSLLLLLPQLVASLK